MATWHGGQDCQAASQAAQATDRPVRALVNSAATFLAKAEERHTGQLGHQPRCQRQGTALMAASIAPLLQAAGGGAIANLASVSGLLRPAPPLDL
jgi:NAD(P)-dependent dehydrogenase (short-subunit alcohol dehydrogenase family)